MSTRLVPIVLLADSDTIAAFQPHVDAAVERLNTNADLVVSLLSERGWTAEMVAWAGVLAALGRAVAAGVIQLDVNPLAGRSTEPPAAPA